MSHFHFPAIRRVLDWLNPFKAGGLRWAHVHVGLTLVLLAYVAGVGSGVGAVFTTQHFARVGGARPVRETHVFRASGAPLPQSHSLAQFAFRQHQQNLSSSCVGQTVATMAEIETYEFRHVKIPMASEFSWSSCNGGVDQGITYECAFDIFTREGHARISSLYPYDDGSTPWAYPSQAVIASAWPFRQTSWRFISPSDQYTIEYEIAHGRPVALLMAVYDNFYNGTTTSGRYIGSDGGHYWFNHSITIIAYDRYGVQVQNSWGPRYGSNGRIWLTWAYIARFGLNLVAANPYEPLKPVFPLSRWNHWTATHHKPAISPYTHGKLRLAASFWWHGHMALGGVKGTAQWHPKGGYSVMPFERGQIVCWPKYGTCKSAPYPPKPAHLQTGGIPPTPAPIHTGGQR